MYTYQIWKLFSLKDGYENIETYMDDGWKPEIDPNETHRYVILKWESDAAMRVYEETWASAHTLEDILVVCAERLTKNGYSGISIFDLEDLLDEKGCLKYFKIKITGIELVLE